MGRASVPTPAVYPAFFFVLEKGSKSAGNAVIPTYPTHWSHGLQGSLKRRYKHPSPTSINGYHAAKKLLSQWPAKRPTFAFAGESGYTHSPSPTGSHTAAYTPKQGPSGQGRYHYPRSVPHVSETLRGRGLKRQTLPLLGLGRRRSRRTQKAFGTAMRLCASLSRGVAAPLGCATLFAIW